MRTLSCRGEGGGGGLNQTGPIQDQTAVLEPVYFGRNSLRRVASDFATLAQMIAIFLALEKGVCVQNTIVRT